DDDITGIKLAARFTLLATAHLGDAFLGNEDLVDEVSHFLGGNATLDWAFAGVTEEAASASRNAAPISRWVRLLSAAFRRSPTTRPSAFTDTLGLPIHANSFTTRL
ncbi:MAG: hypothetical protein ACK5E1_02125, partial [Bradyrhizobium sp.]|uniref:hypothetical protein n=1 Tax=Bradyrhizobium sp. TaxID=376 RepID=UPI00391B148A